MKIQFGVGGFAGFAAVLLGIALFVLAFVGWVMNIIHIAHWSESIGILVLRVCGVFLAPLGAIFGWVL